MRKMIFVVAAGFLASACDERPIESLGYAERMELMQDITDRCMELGIAPDSSQMRDCQTAEIEKEISKRQYRRQTREAFAVGMQSYGDNMSRQAQARRDQPQTFQSQRINCTSNQLGSYTYTNCY